MFQGVGGAVPWVSHSGQKGVPYIFRVCVQQVEMYELLQVADPADRGDGGRWNAGCGASYSKTSSYNSPHKERS